jgi:F0F1-type ATP synthase epsilon subunit
MSDTLLSVVVRDENGEAFQGEVTSISSSNEKGPFDMLYEHTNFITLIREKLVLGLPSGQTKEFTLESGILRCFSSQVEIFLGVGSQKKIEK